MAVRDNCKNPMAKSAGTTLAGAEAAKNTSDVTTQIKLMIESPLTPRAKVAQEIRWARMADRKQGYQRSRSGEFYVRMLHGLEHFFQFVGEIKESSVVIDIGAGTTRGISELAVANSKRGLDFHATILTPLREVNSSWVGVSKLERSRIHITSAEALRGFASKSVAGIISLHALSYTASPELAVRRINEVLVDGGVVKSTIWTKEEAPAKYDEFIGTFRSLGYDITTQTAEERGYSPRFYTLLLAIKPGGDSRISAEELLRMDESHLVEEKKAREVERERLKSSSSATAPSILSPSELTEQTIQRVARVEDRINELRNDPNIRTEVVGNTKTFYDLNNRKVACVINGRNEVRIELDSYPKSGDARYTNVTVIQDKRSPIRRVVEIRYSESDGLETRYAIDILNDEIASCDPTMTIEERKRVMDVVCPQQV